MMKKCDLRYFVSLCAPTIVVIYVVSIFSENQPHSQTSSLRDLGLSSEVKPVPNSDAATSPSYFLRNLPQDFTFRGEEYNEASECAKYPHFPNIKVNNDHYQVLETKADIFYLYGAYLDNRENNKKNSSVRIVGMNKKRKQGDSSHCRIWFNRTESVITKVSEFIGLGWLPGEVSIYIDDLFKRPKYNIYFRGTC